MKLLQWVALALAVIGSLVAMLVAGMTTFSVIGRAFFHAPLNGDVELTTMGIGLALSLCVPWCQYHSSNIVVDFFSQFARPATQRRLDGIGSCMLALMYGLLAWRTGVAAASVRGYHETTMILELPTWWTYAALAPGLGLAAVIAVMQATRQLRGLSPLPPSMSEEPRHA